MKKGLRKRKRNFYFLLYFFILISILYLAELWPVL